MTEQARAFGGAESTALYVLRRDTAELRLADSAGGSPGDYGLPDACETAARFPVAEAIRLARPLWLEEKALAPYREGGQGPPPGVTLGALPLGARGGPFGCLLVAARSPRGFDAEQRVTAELYAAHLTERLEAGGGPEDRELVRDAVQRFRPGAFCLTLSDGMVEADPQALALLGTEPGDFDGRVETLLAHTVPEDLPAMMSLIEPSPSVSGDREIEYRIRVAPDEVRWLHMRCRVLADAAGRPERLIAVIADASRLRPGGDEVSRVQRLSATLATAVTVRDIGEVTVSALRELGASRVMLAASQADRLVVAALVPDDLAAWPAAWRAEWPEVPGSELPTVQAALLDRRMALWPAGTEVEPGLAEVGPGGLAVLPLPADTRTAGLCLVGWEERHQFNTEERFLLTAASALAGQAMVRARAYDARHELAETLQRSLLPRTLPELPGGVAVARYLPATAGLDVGGDWYDVIQLTDRHVALVIGDVQGHSAAAATIMGQIRTAIRAYAVEGHAPDVVVSHANRLMVGMRTDLFATCTYVAMDMEEGDSWFVRAGHLPPLVRDPDGGTRELDIEGGPPLGIDPDAEFPMTTLALAPGSVLVLLTDGLVESAELRLEDGLARVRALMGPQDPADVGALADALLGAADRRDDDVALLALRYDGMRVRPRRASWEVWRLPNACGHARRFASRTLRSWRLAQSADAALLIVSELVTNALVHTEGQVRLDLTLAGERLRIAVSDNSPRTPVKAPAMDWEATGGRGVLLVSAVSSSWGSVPLSGGKQVWAEVEVPPAEREPPPGDGRAAEGAAGAAGGAAGGG
nr:SpoIIE family protein phosphatase [Streptomyces hoynatensis]